MSSPTPSSLSAAYNALTSRMLDQAFKCENTEGLLIKDLFAFTRNGLRAGIAAIEDETTEFYRAWEAWRHNKTHPLLIRNLKSEVLDIAAVAMHIYNQIPDPIKTPNFDEAEYRETNV